MYVKIIKMKRSNTFSTDPTFKRGGSAAGGQPPSFHNDRAAHSNKSSEDEDEQLFVDNASQEGGKS